jgi:hypothetical protein
MFAHEKRTRIHLGPGVTEQKLALTIERIEQRKENSYYEKRQEFEDVRAQERDGGEDMEMETDGEVSMVLEDDDEDVFSHISPLPSRIQRRSVRGLIS